ncbi:Stn1p NDAI_0A03540 [Naumovozyma dairenensis CBS 421]|uniref:CST complex subunit Stn1 N-terminal domain-containing protein n=1 Tax=Naumovozyma dairenensis (strain ATCC 10597 / BCRC 20456 / CBS 421 / NBRC 0211 / NRRL Y-12639) TaxID=1071378 RepID=G0W3X3_NAUDC|nr:hypothetical protein NDAI_0A03540 [Naumovozyma dairenensis CBS 421]CCD22511.1 hypothetical protein NDAI_0A03540 [Naumovozyma dairenensis CBS 421]
MDTNDHIVHRDPITSQCFYLPLLFKHNEYYIQSLTDPIPLLLYDLKKCMFKSKLLFEHYYKTFNLESSKCLFYENTPINKIKVIGRVFDSHTKWVKNVDYIFLKLDDCTPNFDNKRDHDLKFTCSVESVCNMLQISTLPDLTGQRIQIIGYAKLQYNEFHIKDLQFVDTMVSELEFWSLAMHYRSWLMEPWTIAPDILEPYLLTQEASLVHGDEDDVINNSTPIRRVGNKKITYIEKLQDENTRNELEIISPYSSANSSVNLNLNLSLSFNNHHVSPFNTEKEHDHFNHEDEQEVDEDENSDIIIVDVSPETSLMIIEDNNGAMTPEQNPFYKPTPTANETDPPITICNKAEIKSFLLRYLITLPVNSITMIDLYQISEFKSKLEQLSIFEFQKQSLSNIKSFEEIKSEQFINYIKSLVASTVVELTSNDNVIDLSILKKVSKYCNERLNISIKLQNLSISIDYKYIKQKLSLKQFKNMMIIEIFKENIKIFTMNTSSIIKNWYIDLKNEKIAIVYLEYY